MTKPIMSKSSAIDYLCGGYSQSRKDQGLDEIMSVCIILENCLIDTDNGPNLTKLSDRNN